MSKGLIKSNFFFICVLSSEIENAHWAEKTTTTRCGIRETVTTRNFMLRLYLNNRNALWHVKICHVAKVVSWLLTEMTTTSSDFMKIPQGVVVVTFYSHDAMWDKFQPAEGSVSVSRQLASDRAPSWCFLQPFLLIVWRRFLVAKWRSWMTQAVIEACFLITSVTITFYGKLRKLRYCERITTHWLRNITVVLKDTMSWRSMIQQKLTESGSGENDNSNMCYYCKTDELFDVLETAHVNIGHKR